MTNDASKFPTLESAMQGILTMHSNHNLEYKITYHKSEGIEHPYWTVKQKHMDWKPCWVSL